MLLEIAEVVVGAFEAYAAIGVLFALAFLSGPVARFDQRVASAPKTLRLLLLPGVAAFWPLFASRWIRSAKAPVERNSHRALAR